MKGKYYVQYHPYFFKSFPLTRKGKLAAGLFAAKHDKPLHRVVGGMDKTIENPCIKA